MTATLLIDGKNYARLRYGDAVQMAFGQAFGPAGVPQELFGFGDRDTVGKMAFCFLTEIDKRTYNFSPEEFIRKAFQLTPEKVGSVAAQIATILNDESARPIEGDDREVEPLKKKYAFIVLAMLALATVGTMSLLNMAYETVFPSATGENCLSSKSKP
jgi:hypothetical protein